MDVEERSPASGDLEESSLRSELAGDRPSLELRCFSIMHRKAIGRVECRWASIRRRLKKRVQVRQASLEDISGDFLLMRSRVDRLRRGKLTKNGPKRCRRKTGAFEGGLTGGGGARRAALSSYLRANPVGGGMPKHERKKAFNRLMLRLVQQPLSK